MISNPDTDCDPDTNPDPELFFREHYDNHSSPEWQSISGLHGQRPWL
jgi:hypothetical protein